MNAAPNVVGAGTPPLSLRIIGPEDDLPVVIPAWGFTIGPIVKPEERPPGTRPDLRPALPPTPIPTTARAARVAALGLLAAGLLVLVAWRHLQGWWFKSGPFEHALRRIDGTVRNTHASSAYRDTLVVVHAAFNATAGRAVFAHDLSRFFTEHPRFEPLRAPIEALFEESSVLFYEPGGESPIRAQSLERLQALCRACRDVERSR